MKKRVLKGNFFLSPEIKDSRLLTRDPRMLEQSQVLVFRNPFSEPLVISIRLITDERPKIFEVVLKRTDGIMVNASQSLQVRVPPHNPLWT